jgi:hypothetical protein
LDAELGGTSFMAMRLLSMLREACPALQMIDLVEYDTPALLAQRLVCVVVVCVSETQLQQITRLILVWAFQPPKTKQSDRNRAPSYTDMES